jgi:uncharacterized protein (TIGR02611 family)
MSRPKSYPQRLLEKLHLARYHHRQRSRFVRSGFVIAATLIILAGLIMLILPGPGLLALALGFYLLALEFDWAERLLRWALKHADKAAAKTPFVKRVTRAVSRYPKTTAAILAGVLTLVAILVISFWKPDLLAL